MSISPPRVFDTDDLLGRTLAAEIADLIEEANSASRRFILGCPGGRSPRSTYGHLAEQVRDRRLELGSLVIAMMDDYVLPQGNGWQNVPEEAHYSCRRLAHEEIRDVLNAGAVGSTLTIENVWFPETTDPAAYDERLRDAGGIDLFILASGAGDGHVAFNPPGSSRDSRSRIVELAEQTRIDNLGTFPEFRSLDDVPQHGISVGIDTIASLSRRVVMIAQGASKRAAVKRLTNGVGYDSSWPATIYREVKNRELYIDRDALPMEAMSIGGGLT